MLQAFSSSTLVPAHSNGCLSYALWYVRAKVSTGLMVLKLLWTLSIQELFWRQPMHCVSAGRLCSTQGKVGITLLFITALQQTYEHLSFGHDCDYTQVC